MLDVRRVLPWLLVAFLVLAPRAAAEDEAASPGLFPTTWLALPTLDRGGRTPFNPSRVFERYLWRLDAEPPKAGEVVKGISGEEGTWTVVETGADGTVDPQGAGVVYGTVEAPADGMWLAEVKRASALYVNGVPHGGDVYGHGITKVPVQLRKGENRLFAAGFRGKFKVVLRKPEKPVFLATWDATLPDLVTAGGTWSTGERLAGILVVNASAEPVSGLFPRARIVRGEQVSHPDIQTWQQIWKELTTLPPGGALKIAVRLPSDAYPLEGAEPRLMVELHRKDHGLLDEGSWPLRVRAHDDVHRRSFLSFVDDSAQFFGVRPAKGKLPEGGEMGLVVSLHGAGVDAFNQAKAYSARPDFHVVAPTNRRPFGFDWQDWGRRDAYEVIERAHWQMDVPRTNVHVTGHSMGGHGTWHLAANDPDGFASAAPSAGWISFDTYGGRPEGPLTPLWHAADRASLTLDLLPNLRTMPLYVLHGAEDDNVPPSEARRMQKELDGIVEDATFHFEPGKGHWWNGDAAAGADCVDWPPIFEMFRRARVPEVPEAIDVTFADLGLDYRHHWVEVQQPLQYGEPMRVRARREPPDAVVIETENVRRFVLWRPWAWGLAAARVDETVFDPPIDVGVGEVGVPEAFVRADGVWKHAPLETPAGEKRPDRKGPFKRAFDNAFLLVYGTAGDDAEDAALLARARYDAERWRYRANGCAPCIADTELLKDYKPNGRNVILYGNADTNAAWSTVFPESCPILPRRGKVTIGKRSWEGEEYGLLFTYPLKGDPGALAAAVADTGILGSRLTLRPPYFASGVGIPDFVLFGKEILTQGDAGVRLAGFFDHAWKVAE